MKRWLTFFASPKFALTDSNLKLAITNVIKKSDFGYVICKLHHSYTYKKQLSPSSMIVDKKHQHSEHNWPIINLLLCMIFPMPTKTKHLENLAVNFCCIGNLGRHKSMASTTNCIPSENGTVLSNNNQVLEFMLQNEKNASMITLDS